MSGDLIKDIHESKELEPNRAPTRFAGRRCRSNVISSGKMVRCLAARSSCYCLYIDLFTVCTLMTEGFSGVVTAYEFVATPLYGKGGVLCVWKLSSWV